MADSANLSTARELLSNTAATRVTRSQVREQGQNAVMQNVPSAQKRKGCDEEGSGSERDCKRVARVAGVDTALVAESREVGTADEIDTSRVEDMRECITDTGKIEDRRYHDIATFSAVGAPQVGSVRVPRGRGDNMVSVVDAEDRERGHAIQVSLSKFADEGTRMRGDVYAAEVSRVKNAVDAARRSGTSADASGESQNTREDAREDRNGQNSSGKVEACELVHEQGAKFSSALHTEC